MLSEENTRQLADALPFYRTLTEAQQLSARMSAAERTFHQGELIHSGSEDCSGLFLVKSGQIRVYLISENGKEVTLYRLFEQDVCIFSASCMMPNINFDLYVSAEKETDAILIPTGVFSSLTKESVAAADYMNQIMASRFSDVMWVVEQVLFMSFDQRLALFLQEQSGVDGSDTLHITHEMIARHLGTAREVVTRMLKYFQGEGIVRIFRGGVEIIDRKKLKKTAMP